MYPFLDHLRAGLRRCGVEQSRVLVAVSGGADSVALLRGLATIASEFSLELTVAHLNHRLRGAASDADADWVRALAAALALPSQIGTVAPDEWNAVGKGMEETARTVRYQFLEETAAKCETSAIALAHTADDQAETVLHHILRGTGIAGLGGMAPVRKSESGSRLLRPMLNIRRKQVEQFLSQLTQDFRIDATNTDTTMTRNRLRHVVLPLLRNEINPQVDAAICRLAEQATDVEQMVRQLANNLLARALIDQQADACRIETSVLFDQPRHLVREFFRELWRQQHWPQQAMTFEHWNRLCDILSSRETVTFPERIESRFHALNLLVIRQLS
ncbi:tRNA lysidine(34) synthetase TilS [Schlesneria paludicola]|uniref:tRNA lysidine(34) synthetase TilS n=1 Tax=Schlesneria paludicola TaxID=360056 RepID=UPI00029B24C6|nr:tRNA lysidine(34) synthetase TilS [Schlesneria paludicola]